MSSLQMSKGQRDIKSNLISIKLCFTFKCITSPLFSNDIIYTIITHLKAAGEQGKSGHDSELPALMTESLDDSVLCRTGWDLYWEIKTEKWKNQSDLVRKYLLPLWRANSNLSGGGLWSYGSAMAERWTRPSACQLARSLELDPMTAAGTETGGQETEKKQMEGRKRETKAEEVSLFHALSIIYRQLLWCRGYLALWLSNPSVSVSLLQCGSEFRSFLLFSFLFFD